MKRQGHRLRWVRRVAPVPALVLLATSTFAVDYLKLMTGKTLAGAVTKYDSSTETVTFVTTDGQTLQLRAQDLDRLSAYKLAKAKLAGGDAAAQLRLGNIARDVELYVYANRHYAKAVEMDPSLAPKVEEERARLRTEAADYCMAQANAARLANDPAEVEKWLTTLVQKLPDTPQAAEASKMLGETYEKNHAAKDDDIEASQPDLLANQLKTGKKYYDDMLASIKKGLTSSGSAAKREYQQAWASGERALAELDKQQKKLQEEMPGVPALFDKYRDLVHQHMIDSQLNLASALTVQSNYQDALEAVQRALSLDPKNQAALAARSRIELASSRGVGWGW